MESRIRSGTVTGWARPWKVARSQPRRRWVVAASVLLHLSLLLLFVQWDSIPPPLDLPPPAVSMVFESASPHGPSLPNPTQNASIRQAPAQPAPPRPPTPEAPAPSAPPQPSPVPPSPPLAAPEAQTEPAAPPQVSLTAPPVPAPPSLALPAPPDLTAPEPLPLPSPPAPTRPKPRPLPPVRQAERSPPRSASGFPAPMNFSFGAPRTPTALERAFSTYQPGRANQGDTSFSQFAKVTKGQVDADWMSDLHRWWLQHGYYPPQAAMAGEDGTVRIQIQVDRYGRVHLVDLESRSGSQWLDMGAQAVFRGANLPPFPPGTRDDEITVDLTINYILVGR